MQPLGCKTEQWTVQVVIFLFSLLFEVQLSSAIVTLSHLWWAEEHAQHFNIRSFSLAFSHNSVPASSCPARRSNTQTVQTTQKSQKEITTPSWFIKKEKKKKLKSFHTSPNGKKSRSFERSDSGEELTYSTRPCVTAGDSILVSREIILFCSHPEYWRHR